MRLVHGLGLFGAHREGLVMRAGELLPGAQLGDHRLHIGEGALHPLQLGVLEALALQAGAHLMVGEDGAVLALGDSSSWIV